jgi:hypothetical protein
MLAPDNNLRMPPMKPDGSYYDSVKGISNGSDVYMIYQPRRAYPMYLVTYNI